MEQATTLLAAQTHGYVRIEVSYALDFNDTPSLVASVGFDKLIRVGLDAPPVQEFDAEHCCMLGLTQWPVETYDLATDVYLVYDRIEQEDNVRDTFVHVTMHELLHALGLRHVDDVLALMARSTWGGTPTTLNCNDYREASRAWGASARRLSGGRCSE